MITFTSNEVLTATKLNAALASAVSDAAAVPITTAGTLLGRTLQDHFADSLNLRDFGCYGDGVRDDYAHIIYADSVAAAAGKALIIDRPCLIGTTSTFQSLIRFYPSGRFIPAANVKLYFAGSFEAATGARCFDFSASGSGFYPYGIPGPILRPEMFGAAGQTPGLDCGPLLSTALTAAAATGLEFQFGPEVYSCASQVTVDYAGAAPYGLKIRGVAGQSIVSFADGVASPNFWMNDLTGYVSGTQRPEFYGSLSDLQVWGKPKLSGSYTGGVVFQAGATAALSDGSEAVYFNRFNIDGMVIKNAAAGGIGASLHGMTTCNVNLVANAGGSAYDGSIALRLRNCSINQFSGSVGNAEALVSFVSGVNAGNRLHFDAEVGKVAYKNRAASTQSNVFSGFISSVDYGVDFPSPNGGNNVFDGVLAGGIGVSMFRAQTATDGTFGGYGCVLRMPATNGLGATYPGATPATIAVPATGVWVRNVWGQNAMVSISGGPASMTVSVRDWFSTSGSGYSVAAGSAAMVPVLAGESIMLTYSSGSPAWFWRLAA